MPKEEMPNPSSPVPGLLLRHCNREGGVQVIRTCVMKCAKGNAYLNGGESYGKKKARPPELLGEQHSLLEAIGHTFESSGRIVG